MQQFRSDNTEGFTTEQLATMNAAYQRNLQAALVNVNDDAHSNEDLIAQVKKSVAEATLREFGGA